MENPFIKYYLWYYDVLWRYWPIVVVLTIVAVWLRYRRYAKRQREWVERMEKSRKEAEDFKRQMYENDIVRVELSKIKRIDSFEYDCENFHVVIEDGKLTFTDKETGETYVRTGQDLQHGLPGGDEADSRRKRGRGDMRFAVWDNR